MRFRSIHTVVTSLIAALGLTAIAIGGVLHPLAMGAAFLAAAASSVAAREPLISRRWYARAWTVGLGLALALEALRVATGTSPIEAGIELAILLQINRLWSLRSAREHGQVVVLALVHLIAASVLDQGISYGALFAGFVLVLPWAMTLSHLRSEIEGGARPTDPKGQRAHVERVLASRRIVGPRFLAATALLALPIFVTSAALFVLFPRVGLGFLGGGPRSRVSVAGFSDEVRLGDHGLIRDDATVVLRFELDPLPSPPPARLGVHFRGAAYDAYDGRQWTRTRVRAAAVT